MSRQDAWRGRNLVSGGRLLTDLSAVARLTDEAADPASSLREQVKAELEEIEGIRAQLLAREQELQQGMKS